MDRLFNQVWGGGRRRMRGRSADAPQMWMPQVEMCERGGKLHVFTDLPGMRKDDVKLSIDGDQLVIEGERRSSHDEGAQQQGGFFHTERSYGSFYRSIPLPESVDPGTVDASFKDGVLDVCFDVPKPQQAKSRQVQIRDGGSGAASMPSESAGQSQQSGGGSQQ
jgi:HSP20 family protein